MSNFSTQSGPVGSSPESSLLHLPDPYLQTYLLKPSDLARSCIQFSSLLWLYLPVQKPMSRLPLGPMHPISSHRHCPDTVTLTIPLVSLRDRKNQRQFRNKRSHRSGEGDGEPRVFYWLHLCAPPQQDWRAFLNCPVSQKSSIVSHLWT